jgi:hypothetical protein
MGRYTHLDPDPSVGFGGMGVTVWIKLCNQEFQDIGFVAAGCQHLHPLGLPRGQVFASSVVLVVHQPRGDVLKEETSVGHAVPFGGHPHNGLTLSRQGDGPSLVPLTWLLPVPF